jgi:hypothetical protein
MPKIPPDLPRLLESPGQADRVQVQDTKFSHDVLGRYVCNDWDEIQVALSDGGFPFDAVVIGGGMFGAYCAAKLYWRGGGQALRVLLIDAGAFLLSTHIQNVPRRLGGSIGGPRYPRAREDGTGAHNTIWGVPWISNEAFTGLAYCLGGRSLFFGGWAPRMEPTDLANWPQEMREYLLGSAGTPAAYQRIEDEIGTGTVADYMSGDFHDVLKQAFEVAAPQVPNVVRVEEAPLAVQGESPGAGLFSFDKFSSGPFFIDAVRADAEEHTRTYGDRSRRLFILPRAHVLSLGTSGDAVTRIDLAVDGQRRSLEVDPTCAVVVANGTIEATRLALESLGVGSTQFGTPRLGNLMGHLRSNIVVRIKRTALGLPAGPPRNLETTALLVRGESRGRRFHIQVTAGAVGGVDSEKNMWQQVPDIDLLDEMRANQDPTWITLTLRGIGEMEDDRSIPPKVDRSWIDLSNETDEWQMRRAYVNLVATRNDRDLWVDMDEATFALAARLAGAGGEIEYWNKPANQWQPQRPQPGPDGRGYWQDVLGTTHHEAGSLFMGDPGASVTDLDGKFHHLRNAYAVGPATFPTLGSANPSLTALTLARRTAGAIVRATAPVARPGFTPLSLDPAHWRMVAAPPSNQPGPRMQRFGPVWETFGGYGLYWYIKEQFSNFILSLEWRVAHVRDNSGVYIRIPAPDVPNALGEADSKGHEIQIDEFGDPDGAGVHRTGAVYPLQAPNSFPSSPVGRWNTYLIQADGPLINVNLNGVPVNTFQSSRQGSGHIALQAHHFGSRVQFRNLQIKKLP